MFASQFHRPDFADTRSQPMEAAPPSPGHSDLYRSDRSDRIDRIDRIDIHEQFAQAEAADRQLLRLVVCAACVTLGVALAGSLI